MTEVTATEQRELDVVRWRLERLVQRRVLSPLSPWEHDLYRRLANREAELLEQPD